MSKINENPQRLPSFILNYSHLTAVETTVPCNLDRENINLSYFLPAKDQIHAIPLKSPKDMS